jgi:hypothetical protein
VRRALLSVVVAAAVSVVVTLIALQPTTATGGGPQVVPNSEVEILDMHRGTVEDPTGIEDIAMRCDGHGHRVYASRHPIEFVVIDDKTCPVIPERGP